MFAIAVHNIYKYICHLLGERPVCPYCDWPQPLTAVGA